MTRVLLIHQAFVSPSEPGGTRHYELAKRALHRGVHFTIVASEVSYLTADPVAKGKSRAGGQDLEGVRVLRSYAPPCHHRGFVWRLVSFLSFMISSVRTALGAGAVDVVMGTSPPIFQAISAWLVSVIRWRPFLLEVRDLWPEFAIQMGVLNNRMLIRFSRRLEAFLYSRADRLMVNSPAYRDYLIAKGVPEYKVSVIPNGVDLSMFDPEATGRKAREEFGLGDWFVVVYAGALGMSNDIETLLRAADRLRGERIKFLIVGGGERRQKLEGLADEMGLENVIFAGARPKKHMGEILAASNAGVATLRDIPGFRSPYPNKVFDYMAAGRPAILAIDGAIREVMDAAGGGVFVQPGDDLALADAVRDLCSHPERAREMGRRARCYVEQHFNRDDQAGDLAKLVIGLSESRVRGLYARFGKRLLDVGVSLAMLLVLSPLFVIIAFLVRLNLGTPVLFRQRRPGLGGRPFTLLKFRTMTEARDSDGVLLPDRQRLTAFGRWLRSTSLDELPELVNVLRGDMSIVGPRPLLIEYLDRYSPAQARRHDVKPGITGLAQVNGRNAISWELKFENDVRYVDRCSFWMDLRILAVTPIRAVSRHGINQPGEATSREFTGTRGG